MPVNVDDVYQRVLALANKEQRGYITPQEFNSFANQAQLEIINQYFYDENQFGRAHGNDTEYSDMLDLLSEKLSELTVKNPFSVINGLVIGGELKEIYRIGTIENNITDAAEIEEVKANELLYINKSKLTRPTYSRPVYTQTQGLIRILPSTVVSVNITYLRKPKKVSWGYVVDALGNALYNSPASTSFELHEIEETELVYKILKLAGVNLKAQDVVQAGQAGETLQIQQEKQ